MDFDSDFHHLCSFHQAGTLGHGHDFGQQMVMKIEFAKAPGAERHFAQKNIMYAQFFRCGLPYHRRGCCSQLWQVRLLVMGSCIVS